MVIRYAYPDIHDVRNTRPCRKCGEVKSVAEFTWRKDTQSYVSRCCSCEAVRMRDYNRRRRQAPMHWTDERNRELLRLIQLGCSAKETAKALRTTLWAVRSQRCRMLYPCFAPSPPPNRKGHRDVWIPARVAALKGMREARMSFSQCAAALGTTRNAIAHGTRYLREARP